MSAATARWPAPIVALHWTVAALVLVQWPLGWLATTWPLSPQKLDLFVWHKSLGFVVLALVVLRIAVRAFTREPEWPAGLPAWQRSASRVVHASLYALLIALPLSGWVVQSASGIPFRAFWLVPVPDIVARGRGTMEVAARVHFALQAILAALVVAHAAAALWHHRVRRDGILQRMLPLAATRR